MDYIDKSQPAPHLLHQQKLLILSLLLEYTLNILSETTSYFTSSSYNLLCLLIFVQQGFQSMTLFLATELMHTLLCQAWNSQMVPHHKLQ